MNLRDPFEVSHHKLVLLENPPQTISERITMLNGRVFCLSQIQKHPLQTGQRLLNEIQYYAYNNFVYQLIPLDHAQLMGDIIMVLSRIKYKGQLEIETTSTQISLEQRKKSNTFKVLSQGRFDNIRDGDEMCLKSEIKLEETDEYILSYSFQFRVKANPQVQNINDEYKIDKKNGLILKSFLPFDSHYSMVTDNFPIVFLEYVNQNNSQQQLQYHIMDFKAEDGLIVEKITIQDDPLILYADESIRILFKLIVQTDDLQKLQKILHQKDNKEYSIKLGHIHLQWGKCGKYLGSTKQCSVFLQPINLKFQNPSETIIFKNVITQIKVDVSLGIFFNPSFAELNVRLDDAEIKNIRILGMDRMTLNFNQFTRVNTITFTVIAMQCGITQLSGIKLFDSTNQKTVPYKSYLNILVSNQRIELDTGKELKAFQNLQLEDLINYNQEQQQQVQTTDLLDIQQENTTIDLL